MGLALVRLASWYQQWLRRSLTLGLGPQQSRASLAALPGLQLPIITTRQQKRALASPKLAKWVWPLPALVHALYFREARQILRHLLRRGFMGRVLRMPMGFMVWRRKKLLWTIPALAMAVTTTQAPVHPAFKTGRVHRASDHSTIPATSSMSPMHRSMERLTHMV